MKYFFITGEISGDLHGAYLINELKKHNKNIKVYGVGGKNMENEGVEIIQDISELAIMGFSEVIRKYLYLKKKANDYIEFIKKNNIKNIVLIDYGGFNLRFLEMIKREIKDIKVFYYIPPKLWVWGKKRIKKLVKSDHILVIFPWEVSFYKQYNIDVIYYGNPFIDKYKIENKDELKHILLLPGSRAQEIKKIMPIYIDIIKSEKDKNFIIKFASEKDKKNYIKIIDKYSNVSICDDKLEALSKKAKLAIAVSGTVTFELALLEVPMVVVYKASIINEIIVKLFIKLKYVSLPNIAMDEMVFPELLQKKCNHKEILKSLDYIDKNYNFLIEKIKTMKKNMNNSDIMRKYSDFIVENSIK